MPHSHSDKSGKTIFGVAALSAIMGAGAALLMAPKDGKSSRRSLSNRFKKFKPTVPEIKTDAKSAAKKTKKATTAAKSTTKTAVKKTATKAKSAS